jgi:hypothetical protein
MHTKLAGRLPLQAMIAQHLDAAQTKLAAVDEKEKKKVEKLVAFEKKEHGHIPSEKEEREEYEKKASAIDFRDPDEIEKLASALELVGEKLAADSVVNGGESKQGGEQLATMGPVGGKQPYKHDKARHQIPAPTTKATKDNPGPANAMATDDERAPGGNGAKYPAKGVLKTAGQGVLDRIAARKQEALGGAEEPAEAAPVVEITEKQASAAEYILGKIAESTQGGMTLDSASGQGPKPPSQPGRQLISSNSAPVSATKKDAKSPRKPELAQVLTEPAMTRATDSKVHENLRNASKGGVKIAGAAAKVYLQKIAEEGCTCGKQGECRYCKLAKAVEAKKAS